MSGLTFNGDDPPFATDRSFQQGQVQPSYGGASKQRVPSGLRRIDLSLRPVRIQVPTACSRNGTFIEYGG